MDSDINFSSQDSENFDPVCAESFFDSAEGVVTTKISYDRNHSIENNSSYSKRKVGAKFNDGFRSVDFVLVWDELSPSAADASAFEKRKVYEKNLEEEGLELESEPCEVGSSLHFIKIHAPDEVLHRYSEILKLRMPMKEELCTVQKTNEAVLFTEFETVEPGKIIKREKTRAAKAVKGAWKKFMESFIDVDKKIFPDKRHRFTAIYSRDKDYLFNTASPNFFSQSVRSRIVQFIMDRTFFSEVTEATHDIFVFGIERLLDNGVYSAAYPLHDGDLKTEGSMRKTLLNEWASVRKWLRYQPLDYIKEYFGVKIGLYFAWLGFYTHMLVPASLVGLCCFIYSWSTLKENEPR